MLGAVAGSIGALRRLRYDADHGDYADFSSRRLRAAFPDMSLMTPFKPWMYFVAHSAARRWCMAPTMPSSVINPPLTTPARSAGPRGCCAAGCSASRAMSVSLWPEWLFTFRSFATMRTPGIRFATRTTATFSPLLSTHPVSCGAGLKDRSQSSDQTEGPFRRRTDRAANIRRSRGPRPQHGRLCCRPLSIYRQLPGRPAHRRFLTI